jgi:hypothetical protein
MKTQEIVAKVDAAKDQFGVVTHDAVHSQLNNFTADDWKQASQIFSKNAAANNDGFYIDDGVDGKVTIHNDMKYAHQIADNSVMQTTMDDAKKVIGTAAGVTALIATSWAATIGSDLSAETGVATFGPEVMAASAAALGTSALYVGAFTGAVGAVVLAGDAVSNYYRKQEAAQDILDNTDVKF